MTHQDLYRLLQTVQKNVRCPQCGTVYEFDNIAIRGIVDSVVFLELNCSNHMPLLATVSFSPAKKAKKKKKNAEEKISSDDVIATHQFLREFTGGFEQIFDSPRK
ncbi:MAG: hypothetical protein BWY68_00020 [bacterium ADurb.Bin400]|nr:MAG: hypothetical protein BWY68_00020 [bacterium ADurb.Bin400]